MPDTVNSVNKDDYFLVWVKLKSQGKNKFIPDIEFILKLCLRDTARFISNKPWFIVRLKWFLQF